MRPDFDHPLAVSIRKQIVEAMARYRMLEDGDKVMVCTSGGKDSSILLALLTEIQRRAPYHFSVEAVMLDQKQPGFDASGFERWVREELGVPLTIVERDTYSIVKAKTTDGIYCTLCSRMRRGILYDHAIEKGFTKLALGHHRDDINQTLLMNLFYTGKMASMPPKLRSDDGRNVVVRPMSFVAEKDLTELAAVWKFPIVPCNLCGSQEGLKRQKIKKLIRDLEVEIPFLSNSILGALSNVHESHLLDEHLYDFQNFHSKMPAADPRPAKGNEIPLMGEELP